jgi:KaiC/GvpD/RAD55 family RecA-like ATPase
MEPEQKPKQELEPEPEYDIKLSKIPTGIERLDAIMRGGIPSGYVIALVSESCAGDFEFSITSIANLLNMNNKNEKNIIIPGHVCYISFMRSKEDILREIAFSFPDYYNIIIEAIHNKKFEFKDLSDIFLNGIIDIDSLIQHINEIGPESLVIINSLTVLAEYYYRNNNWNDFIQFLTLFQKASKTWNGLVYFLLNKEVSFDGREEEILECMDCVIVFQWEIIGSLRHRSMYLKKVRGVLSWLKEDQIYFMTTINSQKGLIVTHQEKIKGRM